MQVKPFCIASKSTSVEHRAHRQQYRTSCAARWPPQYAPAPPWHLTFWPWSRCGSRMWPGVPLRKVSSS